MFLPFLTALVYLIARGDGIARRSAMQAQEMQAQTEQHIRQTAGAQRGLRDRHGQGPPRRGPINAHEYEALKSKALAHS